MLGEIRDLYNALSRKVVYYFSFIIFLMHSHISVYHYLHLTAHRQCLVLSTDDNLS